MNDKNKISNQLETLVIHTNDSIEGHKKSAEKIKEDSQPLESYFLETAAERQRLANELNDRLTCIGEDKKERTSLEGNLHRAYINLKDALTSSPEIKAIIEEAIRGEEKLLDYTNTTLDKLSVVDGATKHILAELKQHIQSTLNFLRSN